jgi:hypothetical protein
MSFFKKMDVEWDKLGRRNLTMWKYENLKKKTNKWPISKLSGVECHIGRSH